MYVQSSDLDIKRVLAQPAAMAVGTGRPARETAEHVLVLYLISLRLDPAEELIYADKGILLPLGGNSLPYLALDLVGELAVWLEHRDAVTLRYGDKMVLEPAYLLTSPARDGAVVNALGLVRDHEVLADADYLAKAPAGRTRAQRAVEAEHVLIGTPEGDPVEFETVHEGAKFPVTGDEHRTFPA